MGKRRSKNKGNKGNFEKGRVEPGYIPPEFIEYYKNQFVPNILSESEFESFISTYKTTLPHVFRLSSNSPSFQNVKLELEEHIKNMKKMGYDASLIDFFGENFGLVCKLSVSRPLLRKNEELHPFRDWLHNHTEVGDITRQEFVSMLPPFFLDVQPNSSVVDMCAAPGSKTMQMLETLDDGLLIANDVEITRCRTLVHQLNRIDTSKVIVINHPAQYIPDIGQFDRVLCDVPCSGDGTFRKNPDATKKWSVRNGCGLHSIQRSILIRGLQMLKKGGLCVYSTCSLNPIEDEAVISSVVNELGGSVSIVDCSQKYPELKRSKGMKTWKVYSSKEKDQKPEDANESSVLFTEYENYDQVPEDLRKQIRETMFPVNVPDTIQNCMRFIPHQNDTGGFFVALLRKDSDIPENVKIQTTQNVASKNWKEAPFVPLSSCENGQKIINEIINDYGISNETFDMSHLFSHSAADKPIKNIFYLSDEARDVVNKYPCNDLRAVLCGARIFSYKPLSNTNDTTVHALPSFEAIDILSKYVTKRTIEITPSELAAVFKAGNSGLQFSELSEESSSKMKNLTIGGLIVKCQGSNLVYGGMKRSVNFTLQVKKERIEQELFKLSHLFPETSTK